eukprot:61542-Pleurochrysis_carterae.AAC.3
MASAHDAKMNRSAERHERRCHRTARFPSLPSRARARARTAAANAADLACSSSSARLLDAPLRDK